MSAYVLAVGIANQYTKMAAFSLTSMLVIAALALVAALAVQKLLFHLRYSRNWSRGIGVFAGPHAKHAINSRVRAPSRGA